MKRILGAAIAGGCLLITGCTATVGGRALPADHRGPLPAPTVAVADLQGLLPSRSLINSVLGTTTMSSPGPRTRMWDDSDALSDRNCLDTWGPAEAQVYEGSGWTAVRSATLRDGSADDMQHLVSEAVVGFPSADGAQQYFRGATQRWTACSNRRVVYTPPGKPPATWTNADVVTAADMITLAETAEGADGWGCQRALGVHANVAIDMVTCGSDAKDQAAAIITKVVEQMPQA